MSSARKVFVCLFLHGVLTQNVADAQGENTKCAFNQWTCKDGTCIYNIGRCDAYPDCQDGSDEVDCKNVPVKNSAASGQKQKKAVNTTQSVTSTTALAPPVVVPLHVDVTPTLRPLPTSLERQKPSTSVQTSKPQAASENTKCAFNQWTCKDGTCIYNIGRCDAYPDCQDGSDEVDCKNGENTKCAFNQWTCKDGTCIYNIGRCDAYPDCQDGSDEVDCKNDVCSEGLRKCSSGECIENYKFCDGMTHCKDNSDELAADCHVPVNNSAASEQKQKKAVNTTQSVTSTTALAPPVVVPLHVDVTPTLRPLPTSLERQKPSTSVQTSKPQAASKADTKLEVPYKMESVNSQGVVSSFSDRVPYTLPVNVDQFSPTTVKYPCVHNYEAYDFCHRRYRGYFKHPTDCSKYIVCEWGFMYMCTCPEQTHWDGNILTCIWDYAAPCDNEPIPPILRMEHKTRQPPVTQTTTPMTTTTSNNLPEVTPIMIPPQVRLRSALPVTPPWLKKLSEQSVLINRDKNSPQYKSLLNRFFKAVPLEDINKTTGDRQRLMK